MHVAAWPPAVDVDAGASAQFSVSITNTSSVIDAYSVQVFGLDPSWVTAEPERLSLFPGDVGSVMLTVSLPIDYPASQRTLAVHVRSENDAGDFELAQVLLAVAPQTSATVTVDPVLVNGGRRADYGVVVANEGNAPLDVVAVGTDPEDLAVFGFEPASVSVPAGRSRVIRATVKGGRPWFGQPRARVFSLGVMADERIDTVATFVQRPRIGRWLLSMMGLLAAAAVFGAVLSHVFGTVVEQATLNEDVLEEALRDDEAGGANVPVNPGSITGRVVSSSTGTGVSGVQADLFVADDTAVPFATAATDGDGAFTFGSLGRGEYKLRFSGAGFESLWYDASQVPADALEIPVELGTPATLDDFTIGGQPGTVSGELMGDDPTGALIRLIVPGQLDPESDAEVISVEASADGSFVLDDVPTPATYKMIVEKTGFATVERDVVVRPAGVVDGVEVFLQPADGVITGSISSEGQALGGARIVATDGTTTIETVSLTEGDVGSFAIRNLVTPGTYTVTVSRDGFATEAQTATLETGAQFSGLNLDLSRSLGTIHGTTSIAGEGLAGGVDVRVTGGDVDSSTVSVTQGDAIGAFSVGELPTPGTYTVTYSAEGYVSQVRLEDLDHAVGRGIITGVDAELIPNEAIIRGVVRTAGGVAVGQADVTLNDGTTELTLQTADEPNAGEFEFAGVPPGAYTLTASRTGTTPVVVLVNVLPAETEQVDLQLGAQASLTGQVLVFDTTTESFVAWENAIVRLFAVEDFPGTSANALVTVLTDADGLYEFTSLDAPTDFVVAVYPPGDAGEALDSALASSEPGVAVPVPTFRAVEVL